MPEYIVVPPDNNVVALRFDIDVTLNDGMEGKFIDAIIFHTQKERLEEHLGAAELVLSNINNLAIRQLITLLQGEERWNSRYVIWEVPGNMAQAPLDVNNWRW